MDTVPSSEAMTVEPAARPTTEAGTGASEHLHQPAPVTRPYPPSWLDRVFDAIDRLQGPTWLAYALLVIPSVALSMSEAWLSDRLPFGELRPEGIFWGSATISILAAARYLRGVAGQAFDAFRPALRTTDGEAGLARYQLTVMPARAILGLTVFSFVITPAYYVIDPVASQVAGDSPAGLVARWLSESFVSVVVLAILFQAIRQMRLVARLHAEARHIDPFQPAPIYAFSRLTSQTAIVLIVFNVAGMAANSLALTSESFVTLYLPWLVAFFVGAVVIFAAPLLGMHRRLVAIRTGLEAEAGGRMRALLMELDAAIDARDATRTAELDATIGALRREQDIVAKLPTWPWSAGTLRGFGSALFLPIVLFLVQRLLSQLLG